VIAVAVVLLAQGASPGPGHTVVGGDGVADPAAGGRRQRIASLQPGRRSRMPRSPRPLPAGPACMLPDPGQRTVCCGRRRRSRGTPWASAALGPAAGTGPRRSRVAPARRGPCLRPREARRWPRPHDDGGLRRGPRRGVVGRRRAQTRARMKKHGLLRVGAGGGAGRPPRVGLSEQVARSACGARQQRSGSPARQRRSTAVPARVDAGPIDFVARGADREVPGPGPSRVDTAAQCPQVAVAARRARAAQPGDLGAMAEQPETKRPCGPYTIVLAEPAVKRLLDQFHRPGAR